jgi:hypothetical protein
MQKCPEKRVYLKCSRVLLSTIKHSSALLRQNIQYITLSNIREASTMKCQISAEFCLVLTKIQTISENMGDISKFLCSQCFYDRIVLENIVLFLIRRIKCDQPFLWSVFKYYFFLFRSKVFHSTKR